MAAIQRRIKNISDQLKKSDNPTNFDYIPIDYNLYPNLNDLPERTIDFRTNMEGLPEFITMIFKAAFIKPEGKKVFFLKCGIYYATDPEFRRLTYNYTFLFLDGLYYGAYPSEDEALTVGFSIKERDGVNYPMFICSVHPKNIDFEYKETVSTVSKSKIIKVKKMIKSYL